MVIAFGMSRCLSFFRTHSCSHGLRIEARFADRLQGQGIRTFLRIDLQRARTKLKSQRADTFQWLQRPTDFRLLGAAVHGRDFEKLALADLGG